MIEEWLNPDPLVKRVRVEEVRHVECAECAECVRLQEQARAALLSGDMSRLTDVRVYQARHCEAEHGC